MRHVFEIDSVQKHYGERSILTDVHLKCQTGEVIGLLGRNGSGKSTLLQIMFGTNDAEKFIRIDGRICEHPYKTPGLIAYLPQHDLIPKYLSVKQAIELYIPKAARAAFTDDELLRPLYKHNSASLSGGEKRYLEVKLLLHSPAHFVLLDEPFNGVAPVVVEQIKLMIQNKSLEKGILLSDHDYRNVLAISTHCLILHQGSIKQAADKEDLVRWGYLYERPHPSL